MYIINEFVFDSIFHPMINFYDKKLSLVFYLSLKVFMFLILHVD